MDTSEIVRSLGYILPEIAVVAAICLALVADLFRARTLAALLGVAGMAAAGGLLAASLRGGEKALPGGIFYGSYAVDGYSAAFQILFLGSGLVVALLSMPAIRGWRSGKGEYTVLLLSCVFGMMLMAGAADLLMMYLSLEFVSITSYIMAGLLRKDRRSAEASLKYIIYGAGASGFMIYGMSYLYGLTGTLNVAEIGAELARQNVPPPLTLITSVLIMAGFGYKVAAVPFHMWCPDVYEGAPTPVTAFFSVGPKAAGFAMLARFLSLAYPAEGGTFEWKLIVALLAVLTMAVGNLGAVHQQNLKRLLAYSSIAHAGYLLTAFVALTATGPDGGVPVLSAMVFYLAVYAIMNLGAFLVVIVLEERYGVTTVDGCRGMGWRSPQLGAIMTVFLFALTGLPPTAGFVAKFLLFSRVVEYGTGATAAHAPLAMTLVVVAVLFSVVSLFYYLRIAAAMYLGKSRDEGAPEAAPGGVYATLLWLLALATVGLGVWWGPLEAFAALARF